MIEVAVYDSKPYDRDYLSRAASLHDIVWRFHESRLSSETAIAAKGAQAVCVIVNDHVYRACLDALAALDVKLIALRCAGHNNVDVSEIAHVTTMNILAQETNQPFLKGTEL
jgi:D-lactate dehydrogenase